MWKRLLPHLQPTEPWQPGQRRRAVLWPNITGTSSSKSKKRNNKIQYKWLILKETNFLTAYYKLYLYNKKYEFRLNQRSEVDRDFSFTLDERNIITKSETRRWDITTHTSAKYFFLSKAWKNSTPHAVCRRMKHSVVRAEVRKNRFESPWRPTVPGPVASARTLTREKVPLMMPKPKPETEINQKIVYQLISTCCKA